MKFGVHQYVWGVVFPSCLALMFIALHRFGSEEFESELFAEGVGLVEMLHFVLPIIAIVLSLRTYAALPLAHHALRAWCLFSMGR